MRLIVSGQEQEGGTKKYVIISDCVSINRPLQYLSIKLALFHMTFTMTLYDYD